MELVQRRGVHHRAHVRTLRQRFHVDYSGPHHLSDSVIQLLDYCDTRRPETQSLRMHQLRLAAAVSHASICSYPVIGLLSFMGYSQATELTTLDFLKCQPINFKGTEGVVGLTQWAEKMESVFLISNCAITNQVKFASCTLQGSALRVELTLKGCRQDVAYTMPWTP
ncbi:hypothetical protein Tco_0651512 [Tanacetum coccineum]|uniref:Uncharacterized protein n=1 Tax=Tanacetum coccineum TaxID=301880 RepID=A0ABQ4WUZ2_9ASTR